VRVDRGVHQVPSWGRCPRASRQRRRVGTGVCGRPSHSGRPFLLAVLEPRPGTDRGCGSPVICSGETGWSRCYLRTGGPRLEVWLGRFRRWRRRPCQLDRITSTAMITPAVAINIRAAAESARRSRIAAGVTIGRIQRRGTSRKAGHRRHAIATMRSASWISIAALTRLRIARSCGRARHATKRQAAAPGASWTTDRSPRRSLGGNAAEFGVGSDSWHAAAASLPSCTGPPGSRTTSAQRRLGTRAGWSVVPATWRWVADSAAAGSGAGSGSNSPSSPSRIGRRVVTLRVWYELIPVCTIAAKPRL